MTLHPIVLQKIRTSSWIQNDQLALQLRLNECNNPYQIFERVFLNVSASCGKNWKDIYNANPRNKEVFSELCVAAILIDRWLLRRFRLEEDDRIQLLGARLAEIVYKYKISYGKND